MEVVKKPSNVGSKVLFKNPILELLTRTHISITLVMYTVLPAVILYYGLANQKLDPWTSAILFLSGIIFFTLVEYVMHRFLFHLPASTPRRKEFARVVHGAHHEHPRDKDRISMPPLPSILLATFFFVFFYLLLGDFTYGFLPGFYFGYCLYSGVHYMVHAYQPPRNFLKVLWVHHGIHHYKDHDNAFGVSSPLWDYVFKTMPRK